MLHAPCSHSEECTYSHCHCYSAVRIGIYVNNVSPLYLRDNIKFLQFPRLRCLQRCTNEQWTHANTRAHTHTTKTMAATRSYTTKRRSDNELTRGDKRENDRRILMHLSAFGHNYFHSRRKQRRKQKSRDKTWEVGGARGRERRKGRGGGAEIVTTTIRADVYQTTFLLFVWFIIFFSREKKATTTPQSTIKVPPCHSVACVYSSVFLFLIIFELQKVLSIWVAAEPQTTLACHSL